MSIHADLSPEAAERLAAQRRNSTILSIVISILVVLLIFGILAVILLKPFVKDDPVIVSYSAPSQDEEQQQKKQTTRKVQPKPEAPSSSMAKVIAANTASPTAVPVPEVDVVETSLEFGSGDDFGAGWGEGDAGAGGGFEAIPSTMRKRCSKADRLERLEQNGGTEACEIAVTKGLDWLARTQNEDGSWGKNHQPAMTGFALLCFLGRCETPLSAQYGENVLAGITYLVDIGMKQEGKLYTTNNRIAIPYEHSIATYAIGEATTFAKQLNIPIPNLEEVCKMSCEILLETQHSSGSWSYELDKNQKGDLSVSAWCVQALKACYHTGIDFPGMKSAVRDALDYTEGNQADNGGFGYRGTRPAGGRDYFSLTGAGMLCFQMWDKGNASEVRKGAEYIRENSKLEYKNPDHSDLYAHYYESQAMIARGGEDWEWYNDMFRDEILNAQQEDGSFAVPGDRGHRQGDEHYRTCLCILMLETYYRFLPGTAEGVR